MENANDKALSVQDNVGASGSARCRSPFPKNEGPGSRVHKPKSRTWDPIYYKVKLVVKEDPVGTGAPRLGPKSGAR